MEQPKKNYLAQYLKLDKDEFINAIPTGIGVFEVRDGITTQLYMNDGFYRLLEDDVESRLKRQEGVFMNSIHPLDQKKVAEAIHSVITGEDYVSVTCRVIKGDGEYKWIRFTSCAAKREENYILVYSVYISMEKEVESRKAMEESRAILETAIHSIDMSVWEYDCEKHMILQTENSIDKHGFGSEIPDVPESLIEQGYVRKDFCDAYRDLFRRLQQEQKVVSGDFRVKDKQRSGEWWERVILTPVLDEDGRMRRALGCSLDVSMQKEREEHFYHQIDSMAGQSEDNLIAKAQYNLTKKELMFYSANSEEAVKVSKEMEFADIIEEISNRAISKTKRKIIKESMDLEYLIEAYSRGNAENTISFRCQMNKSTLSYVKLHYFIVTNPENGNLILFAYCYDDTKDQLEHMIFKQIEKNQFEMFGIISMENGDYVQRSREESIFSVLSPRGEHAYDTMVKVLERYVKPKNMKKISRVLEVDSIRNRLEKTDTFAFAFSIENEDGEMARKKLEFQYFNEEKDILLCTFSDVTEIYLQEQEQLAQTKEALSMAEQATEAKTEFLSRMSHDIRTPLNAILGTATLARDEIYNPEMMKEYLETIDASGKFLLGLINDILDINKIESGKIELRPEPVKVSGFSKSIDAAIRPLMEKKHIDFQFRMECGYTDVVVDKLRHHQIFFNLLSNAAKYTPEFGCVTYQTKRLPNVPEGMAGVRNIVKDNGIGMSKEYMKHLFEPFSRDENAQINQIEGTGLGLAIVKNIVDAMGGEIQVKSELGKGTEFIVDLYMPLGNATDDEDEEVNVDEEALKGKRILVVEDNQINMKIARKMLEKKECTVTSAGNGQEAVDIFSQKGDGGFDVILMDIRMPILNGIDATKKIRSLSFPDAKKIPIIAMTADAFSEDRQRTKEAGMTDHLSKPMEPKVLYETLGRVIQK